jgi:hypothetical protein
VNQTRKISIGVGEGEGLAQSVGERDVGAGAAGRIPGVGVRARWFAHIPFKRSQFKAKSIKISRV